VGCCLREDKQKGDGTLDNIVKDGCTEEFIYYRFNVITIKNMTLPLYIDKYLIWALRLQREKIYSYLLKQLITSCHSFPSRSWSQGSFMGYSLRTKDYRYTAWVPYLHRSPSGPGRPDLVAEVYDEELYCHADWCSRLEDMTATNVGRRGLNHAYVAKKTTASSQESRVLRFDEKRERENLIDSNATAHIQAKILLRDKLIRFLKDEAIFGLGESRDAYLKAVGMSRKKDENWNTSYRDEWSNIKNNKMGRHRWKNIEKE